MDEKIQWEPTLNRRSLEGLTLRELGVKREIRLNRLDDLRSGREALGEHRRESFPAMVGQLEADLDLINEVIQEKL